MIVVLFESSVAPGVESFRDMYGFVVGERLSTNEPGALRHVENRQQRRKKPPGPRCRRNSRRERRGCRLNIFRPGHSRRAAFAGRHFTSAQGKVPPPPRTPAG